MWNAINSMLIGAGTFGLLYGVGWWAWRVDPHMLTIPAGIRPVQDPLRPGEVGPTSRGTSSSPRPDE